MGPLPPATLKALYGNRAGLCGHMSNRVGRRAANRIRKNWWRIKASAALAMGSNVRNSRVVGDPCFPHHPITLLQNI